MRHLIRLSECVRGYFFGDRRQPHLLFNAVELSRVRSCLNFGGCGHCQEFGIRGPLLAGPLVPVPLLPLKPFCPLTQCLGSFGGL